MSESTSTIDQAAEQLAQDLLHDPEFREQLKALVRTAFKAALSGQHEDVRETVQRLEGLVEELLEEVQWRAGVITPETPAAAPQAVISNDPRYSEQLRQRVAECSCGSDDPRSARFGHAHLVWCPVVRRQLDARCRQQLPAKED